MTQRFYLTLRLHCGLFFVFAVVVDALWIVSIVVVMCVVDCFLVAVGAVFVLCCRF